MHADVLRSLFAVISEEAAELAAAAAKARNHFDDGPDAEAAENRKALLRRMFDELIDTFGWFEVLLSGLDYRQRAQICGQFELAYRIHAHRQRGRGFTPLVNTAPLIRRMLLGEVPPGRRLTDTDPAY